MELKKKLIRQLKKSDEEKTTIFKEKDTNSSN